MLGLDSRYTVNCKGYITTSQLKDRVQNQTGALTRQSPRSVREKLIGLSLTATAPGGSWALRIRVGARLFAGAQVIEGEISSSSST